MKPRIPIYISFFCCALIFASIFLPWWVSFEYKPHQEIPLSKQSIHIFPSKHVVESKRLVVYYEKAVQGVFYYISTLISVIQLISGNLCILGMILINKTSDGNKHTGIVIISAALLVILSILLFTITLPATLSPWFTTFTGARIDRALPIGLETRWGPTWGYNISLLASGLLLIIGYFATRKQINNHLIKENDY